MKTEELLKLGITEEQATKILEMHKNAISGNYVPKATFDEERNKVKEYTKLLEDAKADAEDAEGLKKQIEDLKAESKKMQETYAAQELHREHLEAVRKLLPEDIIDADDIISRLDIDSYTYKGDTVKGLSEDIDTLRKTKPHYFKATDEGDDKGGANNNFIKGIVGMQKPSESAGEGGSHKDEPLGVQLGKQLGQLRMQSEQQSQKARETFFK